MFLEDRRSNNCRYSTLQEYGTELKLRLLPQVDEELPRLGPQNIRRIKRRHMKAHFKALRKKGCTVSQVNKAIKTAKALFSFAFDQEYIRSNIMQRFPRMKRVAGEPKANRGVFTEEELQSIVQSATPFELGLCGMLSTTGARPGEIYTLDWSCVFLDVERPYLRIERSWCSKAKRFYFPKTEAGDRTVPIAGWLAQVLREHRDRTGGVGLVFPSAVGTPLNTSNVRSRVWIPLLERAKVRYRDLYSLRWTFVSFARSSGEPPFNVSRIIGQTRSLIVDTIYPHTVESGVAGVSERAAKRAGFQAEREPEPPGPPTPVGPPRLRVIEGGRREGNTRTLEKQ